MQRPSRAERWSSRALSLAKAAARVVPKRVREGAWDRFFGAVFQATRVTNDAYPQPEGAIPEPDRNADEGR